MVVLVVSSYLNTYKNCHQHFTNLRHSTDHHVTIFAGVNTCLWIYIPKYLTLMLLTSHLVDDQRRQWQPTPVLLPGKSHGQRSLGAAVHGVAKSRTRLSNFTFTFLHWWRKWQPIPVFLPGESQGRGSLVGCCL